MGNRIVKYAICCAENPVELFKESDEFFGNIIADVGNSKKDNNYKLTFFSINNQNIYSYAIKLPEKGEGIILRLMNLSDEEQKISLSTGLNFSFYTEVNGAEEKLSEQFGFEQQLVFKPYELKNIHLEKEK